jgi:hypothetical protein
MGRRDEGSWDKILIDPDRYGRCAAIAEQSIHTAMQKAKKRDVLLSVP